MSDLAHFAAYAQAFEIAFLTDDWSHIEPHFTDDAAHVVAATGLLAADDQGRDAVVSGLRDVVHQLDRRFDVRIPEILEGPMRREDGVWMRFRLTLRREGVPDLEIEGTHLAAFRDGRIARIDERVAPQICSQVDATLRNFDALLKPARSPLAAVPPQHARDLREALMRSMVQAYAGAKCQQDVAGALSACTEGFQIDTIPFRLCSRDAADTASHLGLFFAAFPDYRVTVESTACNETSLSCWGNVEMTWRGDLIGQPPTGRAASLPFVSVFDFEGTRIAKERFFFDLSDLCRQIGAPLETIEKLLDAVRSTQKNEKSAA